MIFSVFGANGFIGKKLIHQLKLQNLPCQIIPRNSDDVFSHPLGNVIYCIGLTSDFRYRPLEAIEAHTGYLTRLLKKEWYICIKQTRHLI